jgi:LuxR family maltose regulon positive regulatory protein
LSFVVSGPEQARELLDRAPPLEGLEIAVERVRVAVALHDLPEARRELARWPGQPEPRARLARTLWSAVVANENGDNEQALAFVASVINELEEEGQIGMFLNIGTPIVGPMRTLAGTNPSPFVREILDHPRLAAEAEAPWNDPLGDQLTTQEMVVLAYLPSWLSNAAIAEQLDISINTVKTHLKHIYRKLDAADRKQAVEISERLGLL